MVASLQSYRYEIDLTLETCLDEDSGAELAPGELSYAYIF